MAHPAYPRIGDLLLARGLVSDADLTAALTEQKKSGRRLGDILVNTGRITPADLVDVLSECLGIPKIWIDGLIADPEVVNIIPLRIAKKHRVVAQRLIRRLCPDCAVEVKPSGTMRNQLGFDVLAVEGTWKRAVGCRKCRGSGSRGQIGIFELFLLDDTARTLIA